MLANLWLCSYLRAAFFQKLPKDEAVAVVFIFAVAPDAEVRVVTEGGQYIKSVIGIWPSHFGPKLSPPSF